MTSPKATSNDQPNAASAAHSGLQFNTKHQKRLLAEFAASKLSVEEFCDQHHLPAAVFLSWHVPDKKVAGQNPMPTKRSPQPQDMEQLKLTPITLQPLDFSKGERLKPQPIKQPATLLLPSGLQLQFPVINNVTQIAQLIKEINTCN